MSQQNINIGSTANDGTGDPLRTAFNKINENFSELYAKAAADVQLPPQLGFTGGYLTTNGVSTSWTQLPTATHAVLGGVKVDDTTITINNGVISAPYTYTLPTATTSTLGGVKVDGTSIVINSGAISQVSGTSLFKGFWNASTNTPAVSASQVDAQAGWLYIVNVAGTRNIGNGSHPFYVGDLIIYDGTYWNTIPGNAGSVVSFNGRTGILTLTSTDVSTALGYTPIQTSSLSITTTAASGSGSLNYNTSTGVFTFTPPNLSGYLTSITSGQVTTALGYTPYNSTNPSNYISSSNLSVTTNAPGTQSLSYSGGVFTYTPYALPTATTTTLGGVKVDGTTITITNGVITSVGTGSVIFKGTWNASTNTPALASGSGTLGWEYLVSTTGTRNLGNGSITYTAGDLVIYDGTNWIDIPGTGSSVSSFNTRTGAVTLTSADVTTALGFTPYNSTNPSNHIALTALSVSTTAASGSGSLSYNNTSGVFTFTPPNLSSYLTGITSSQVTTALGYTPIQLTSLSVGVPNSASGSGAISYNSTSGVFTFTPPVIYTTLAGLTDINVTGVTNNQVLTYNTASSKWVAATPSSYTLPTATTSTLGGVKVDGTTVTITNGVITAPYTYTLPTASAITLGGVKVDGTTIVIDGSGVISGTSAYTLPVASASTLGGVKVDGTTVTINNGVITAPYTYTLPTATPTSLGGVKVDGVTITINASGVISGSSSYSLPAATTSTLGGVKVDGVTITADVNGVISSVSSTYTLPTASTTVLGGVKVDGSTVTINGSGVISAAATFNGGTVSGATTFNSDVTVGGSLVRNGNISASAWTINGAGFKLPAATYTDTTSTGSVNNNYINVIGIPTIASTSVTTVGTAANLYIAGDPVAGTNATVSTSYGLYNAGKSFFLGGIRANGGIQSGGGASMMSFSNSAITMPQPTASTAYNNGALVVSGGVGIAGAVFTNSTITAASYVVQTALPSFRVIGNSSTAWTTTSPTSGIMTSSQFTLDYQQGTGLNTTTGIFTCAVAGLYSVSLQARCKDNASPTSQTMIVKTTTGSVTSTVVMLEWAANTTVNHIGSASTVKLAVGDTLKFVVTVGSINFDQNDSWSVAFLG